MPVYIPSRKSGSSLGGVSGDFVTVNTDQGIYGEKIFYSNVEFAVSGDAAILFDTYAPSSYSEIAWGYRENPSFGQYVSFDTSLSPSWTIQSSGQYWSLFGYYLNKDLFTIDISGNAVLSSGTLSILSLNNSTSGNFLTWNSSDTLVDSGQNLNTIIAEDLLQDRAMSGALNTITYSASANAFAQSRTISYATSANAFAQSRTISYATSANALAQATTAINAITGSNILNIARIRKFTTSISLSASNYYNIFTGTTANITCNLPPANINAPNGAIFKIKHASKTTNYLTIAPYINSIDNIELLSIGASVQLASGQLLTLTSDGSATYFIG